MTNEEFKEKLAAIKEQEKTRNVKISIDESTFIDKDHLDSLWYSGDIGSILYEDGWELVFRVAGHADAHGKINGQEFSYNSETSADTAYHALAQAYGIDDKCLHELLRSDFQKKDRNNYIHFTSGTWVEVNAVSPEGFFFELDICDNAVGSDVLDAFKNVKGHYDYVKEGKSMYSHKSRWLK